MPLISYDPSIPSNPNDTKDVRFLSFQANIRDYLLTARNGSFKAYRKDNGWWIKHHNAIIRVQLAYHRVTFTVYMAGCEYFRTWTATDGRYSISTDKLDRRLRVIHNYVEKNRAKADRFEKNQFKDQELRQQVRSQWNLITENGNSLDNEGFIGKGSRQFRYVIDPEGVVFRGIPPLDPSTANKVMKLIQESTK